MSERCEIHGWRAADGSPCPKCRPYAETPESQRPLTDLVRRSFNASNQKVADLEAALDDATKRSHALKLGLQQAITEMRDDRLTWGIHGKTLLIRQFEVLKLADRIELLAGLTLN